MANFARRHFIQMLVGGSLVLAARPGLALAASEAIDESGFVSIGGIDQWIAVQGRGRPNPIILYLHGGPGEAQSPFLKEFAAWENDFTVANWDQRGAGKTYGRNGASTPDVTLDRLADDVCEIAAYLCNRFSQKKIILVGQSWGSILGVHAIKRRPEFFHAFVGTGQVVSFAATVASQVAWARQQASAAGDAASLKSLDEAAAMPENRKGIAQAGAAHKWLTVPQDSSYGKMITDFMAPKPAAGDVADWIAGAGFSGSKLRGDVLAADLRKLGLDMPIPFFVIQGRDDHIVSFEASKSYVEEMRAPAKAFIPIDGGHYACFTAADQFVAALRKTVRPLAS